MNSCINNCNNNYNNNSCGNTSSCGSSSKNSSSEGKEICLRFITDACIRLNTRVEEYTSGHLCNGNEVAYKPASFFNSGSCSNATTPCSTESASFCDAGYCGNLGDSGCCKDSGSCKK